MSAVRKVSIRIYDFRRGYCLFSKETALLQVILRTSKKKKVETSKIENSKLH